MPAVEMNLVSVQSAIAGLDLYKWSEVLEPGFRRVTTSWKRREVSDTVTRIVKADE
jgi:hypothetical protein